MLIANDMRFIIGNPLNVYSLSLLIVSLGRARQNLSLQEQYPFPIYSG